ncbi:MAG: hypothetical protein HQ510_08590 [Candidatus Marinimicrobia bacterium]|nr:hypothetical protein [Candidatus Neomarinimicrobiota bacterium]
MKKITAIITLCIILLGIYGCESPVKQSDNNSGQGNTLNDSSLNGNFIGSASDYFYDFEKNIDVKFYRWDIAAINQPILFNPDTDTLNFRTFPEYLLNIAPGEIGEPFTDLNNNGLYDTGEPFVDQGNGLWELGEPFMDSNNNGFFDAGETYEDMNGDGYWELGEPFMDSNNNGFFDAGETYEDMNGDGYWTGTERLYDLNGDCMWNDAETYEDLDNNGEWTPPETLSNQYINYSIWDPAEPYEDLNDNGQYDLAEPLTDLNGDLIWTAHEPFTDWDGDDEWDDIDTYNDGYGDGVADILPDGTPLDIVACGCIHIFTDINIQCGTQDNYEPECGDTYNDLNGNGIYDTVAEPYEDIYSPFGQFNPDELFEDVNDDGVWTPAEPFTNLNTNVQPHIWNDDEDFEDWNSDGVWTPGEPVVYEYYVNGVWNDAENFDDLDGDNIWDNNGEQFEDMNGDCLWSVGESFLDQPDDPSVAEWNSFTEQHLFFNETIVNNIPVEIFSNQINHLKMFYWDFDLGRYTQAVSVWEWKDTTITFHDPYDSVIYQQPVVSPPSGNNSYYIDRGEWVGSSYVYTSGDSLFSTTFHMKEKMLGLDSLMYKHPADCNRNGVVDPSEFWSDINSNGQHESDEPYTDQGNGILDLEEPYFDRDEPGEDGYGVYNLDEPFVDMNCNGAWDPAETVDTGNGIWDGPEPDDLVVRSIEPSNLLVSFDNHPDLSTYRVLLTIGSEEWFEDCGPDSLCEGDPDYIVADEGEGNGTYDPGEVFDDFNGNGICCEPADSVITYDGQLIRNIIEVSQYDNVRTKQVANVDSLVTVYSYNIIEEYEVNPDDNNYYITKTKSLYNDSTNPGIVNSNYDYHIFKANSHVYKLVHPSYFLPPGFYSPLGGALEDGFWFENFSVDEVLYYTPGGNFRDGEYVFRDTTVTTAIGNYYIEKSFSVDQDNVTVPARKNLGYRLDGEVICYANETLEGVVSISQCPKDTTFANVFKVTNQIQMTLIGPGIKYGEKTITWLASNHGMVKEQVFIRWNEAPWESSSDWIEYSKLELAEFRELNTGSGGLMRNLFGQTKSVNLNTFGNEGELDYDPYQIKRTAGFQRISLPSNND